MKKIPYAFAFCSTLSLLALTSGCSKNHGGSTTLAQTDPAPNPAPTVIAPSPIPSPSPSPSSAPSPTPSPTPAPAACDSKALGEFALLSSYSFGSSTFKGMNISHGVVAPTLSLDTVDLGYGLDANLGRYDIVGDKIDIAWTTAETGGLAYGTSLKFNGEGVDIYGMTKKTAPVNYATLMKNAIALQLRLVDYAPNGTVTATCSTSGSCKTTLTGTQSHLNVFKITAAQLKKGTKFVIDVPKGATALVQIDEQNVKLEDLDLRAPPETVWTLLKRGGTFTIDFMTLTGNVFLLDSTFEMDDALLMGRVVAKTFTTPDCNDDDACSTIDSQEMPASVCL